MYCEGHVGADWYIFGGILKEGRWSASAATKVFIVWHAIAMQAAGRHSKPGAAPQQQQQHVMEPTPRPDLPGCRGWLLLGEYSIAVILLYEGIRDA